jgi:hypothetical protein
VAGKADGEWCGLQILIPEVHRGVIPMPRMGQQAVLDPKHHMIRCEIKRERLHRDSERP